MFTHIDSDQQPTMVDIGRKNVTQRLAKARVMMALPKEIPLGSGEIYGKKGAVFQTAIVAGTMAVKRTHELIPFCHPLAIEKCAFRIDVGNFPEIAIECEVAIAGKTGVEMEAMTGASIAALTVYDMCKSFSHDIVIGPCMLVEKSGGKSEFKRQ